MTANLRGAALILGAVAPLILSAQAHGQTTMENNAIRAEIAALRQQQADIAALQQAAAARLADLEARLSQSAADAAPAVMAAAPAPAAPPPKLAVAAPRSLNRITVSGDFRLRAQQEEPLSGPARLTGQVRARLGVVYRATDHISIGGRLVTGDADDPNSTDVQLSDFADDFQVSLDQAYLRAGFGGLTLWGGKIPQPFVRTELLWDGDVNPGGLAAVYRLPLAGGGALRASALYSIVDEQATQADSTLTGVQIGYEGAAGRLRYEGHLAYLDYTLGGLGGGDAGDFRTNLRRPDGRYLSDFDLVDFTWSAAWPGLGAHWPVKISGDLVRNRGAATNADSGYMVDLALGQASKARDWRVALTRMRAEQDAVFAAFSHDNIPLATNYELNSLQIDQMLRDNLLLSGVIYHYRSLAGGPWADRVRLSLMTSF